MKLDGLQIEVGDDDLRAAEDAALAALASGTATVQVATLSEELVRLELTQARQIARELRHRPLRSVRSA